MNILELGAELGNISEACRKLGVSRQHFYDIKSAVREKGSQGLLEESRRKPRIGNRVNPEVEEKLLEYSLEFLTHGQVQALESAKEEKQAHGEIETHHPGFLLGQDTY